MITVLAGGVGAAKFLTGLLQVVDGSRVTAVVNTGDDTVLHGLHISPDLDTVTYTLAGAVNPETGWGLVGETWQAMEALERYGGLTWFRLGDRDLATHLYRTQRLSEGAGLSEVTEEVARAWGLPCHLVPVTDDPLRTMVTVDDPPHSGRQAEIGFQDYFVRLHHDVAVRSLRFEGAEVARPAPGVLEAIDAGEPLVIAPSNPLVSIAPLLAVSGVREAVRRRRAATIAISPIVAGKALKGPADRLLAELGHDSSVVGVARLYADLAATLVIDEADLGLARAVEAEGLRCIVAPTVMSGPVEAAALATTVLEVAGTGS